MKSFKMILTSVLLVGIIALPTMAKSGRGIYHNQHTNFDVKTVITVNGEVKSLDSCPHLGKGMQIGVCFTLVNNENTFSVHTGPSYYLESEKFTLKVGDKLEVTGSKVTIDKKISIIATKLKNANFTLKLRDDNGIPLWTKGKKNRQ